MSPTAHLWLSSTGRREERLNDKERKTLGGDWQLRISTHAATLKTAIGEISWRKSRESCLTEAVRELSRGCGAAKMEPAAAGPGPLIVNNKQPQPPPPPPPATAQPPPGAPRAAGGLLPGGKAREFNRNQRKDSEVGAAGGRGWHGAGGRGGPGAGAASGPSRASGWLDRGLGAVSLPKTVQLRGWQPPRPRREKPGALSQTLMRPGKRSCSRGRGLRHSPPGVQNRWSARLLAPHHFRPLILGGWWATPVASDGTQESLAGA